MRSKTTARARRSGRRTADSGGLGWLFLLVLAVAAVGVGAAVLDDPGVGVAAEPNATATTTTPPPSPTQTPTAAVESEITQAAIQREFLALFNAWRVEHGLSKVRLNDRLTDMGHKHSEYMAKHDELTHVEEGGRGVKQRFRDYGLLTQCKIPIRGSNEYYPGAENAAQTWVYTNVITDNGTEYYDSAEDVAQGLLRQWINSPGHRRPMAQPAVDEIGLGIVITDDNKVWASLEFC